MFIPNRLITIILGVFHIKINLSFIKKLSNNCPAFRGKNKRYGLLGK
jgi:hypothetical protein